MSVNTHLTTKGIIQPAELIEVLIGGFTFENYACWPFFRWITVQIQAPSGRLKPPALPQQLHFQAFDICAESLADLLRFGLLYQHFWGINGRHTKKSNRVSG